MLNSAKRSKLLAGTLAAVMVLSVAGCGNTHYREDDKEQNRRGGLFYPGYFGGTHSSSNLVGSSDTSNGSSKSISNSTSNSSASKIGTGKTGIGSGMSRGSGHAIS